jgi:hypothetical protein
MCCVLALLLILFRKSMAQGMRRSALLGKNQQQGK